MFHALVYQPPRTEAGQPPLRLIAGGLPSMATVNKAKAEEIKACPECRKGSFFAQQLNQPISNLNDTLPLRWFRV